MSTRPHALKASTILIQNHVDNGLTHFSIIIFFYIYFLIIFVNVFLKLFFPRNPRSKTWKTKVIFLEVWRDHFLSGTKTSDYLQMSGCPLSSKDPTPEMEDRDSLDREDDHFMQRLLYKSSS